MKNVRTHPKKSIISVRSLLFIYVLLCVLMALFFHSIFTEIFHEGKLPSRLTMLVFFTIPVVLLIFLGLSAYNLFADIIARRAGSKFKARLLGYFIVVVVFSAAPGLIITGLSIKEVMQYWKGLNSGAAVAAGRSFAVDNYSLSVENFERLLKESDFLTSDTVFSAPLPPGIAFVQDFRVRQSGEWYPTTFRGSEEFKLEEPPAVQQGFISRMLPRDAGIVRYVLRLDNSHIRIISYSLGELDSGVAAIDRLDEQFQIIDSIQGSFRTLIFFYYGVFFFPTLLMTLIIAISFTRRVTYPIVELTEATRRVAEGDFSIQILARRGDELGLLIRSFNSMVQDLEKSRAALVKTEKISIWQNMAQQLAHEIKNPLTPIKLSAERVLRRWRNEPEKIGEILENSMLAIIQETEGLSTLLTEFRTLSKPMEPSKSWTNLVETMQETIAPYHSSHPEVEFKIFHTVENISIKMDKHRLSQILMNLIINAIDAMDDKGVIEIRTDIVKKRDVSYCRISIKDSGKGISNQEGQLIFTPYFTTKESGTGLGLPIVERIITDHGGAIWFNSSEGLGTIFFVDIPVDSPGTPAVETSEAGGK